MAAKALSVALLALAACSQVAPAAPALTFSVYLRAPGGAVSRVGPWTPGTDVSGRRFLACDTEAPVAEIAAALKDQPVRGLALPNATDTTLPSLALTLLDLNGSR